MKNTEILEKNLESTPLLESKKTAIIAALIATLSLEGCVVVEPRGGYDPYYRNQERYVYTKPIVCKEVVVTDGWGRLISKRQDCRRNNRGGY